MNELVSIIIVTYNEINHIERSIRSLLSQNYKNFEIIVYDNGSVDGTQAFVRERFPEINMIEGKKNLGYGGACNVAANVALGKYLAFLNCDSYVHEDWLDPLVDTLENDPSIGAVGAELVFAEDCKTVLSHGTGIHLSGVTYARDWGKPVIPMKPFEIGGVSGGAFLISRQLFQSLSGFEGSFFLYYEDTDLSLRLREIGKKCVLVPGSKVYHSGALKFSYKKIFYLERNRYLSIFSVMSWRVLLIMFPAIVIFELISWGYCILRGFEGIKAKLLAWKEIILKIPWIAERRKCIHPEDVNIRFFLDVFTDQIFISYVHSRGGLQEFVHLIGWISASPFLRLAKSLAQN